MPVLTGAEPFAHEGSDDIGVLLCHGFTGTPHSMRPWAEHLAAEGFSVRVPLLPGHGTRWQDMNRTRWQHWYDRLDTHFGQLSARCRSTFVFGLSMGGTLALRLAQRHGAEVAGLALVNPSLTTLQRGARLVPLLSKVWPSVAGIADNIAKPGVHEVAYDRTPLRAAASLQQLWGVVRDDLGRVQQPLLLFRSAVDPVVPAISSRLLLDGVTSDDVTEVVLPDSYHVATLDHDAPTIFAASTEFARRVHESRVGEAA
ncbi:alpha/beta hydrolase [Allokutzneria multivorans]|uniref:alpha/beta hydrolase n=1 Tax=Allokutzneria multivorans TaxID=1142134 RepID=UPI0031F05451